MLAIKGAIFGILAYDSEVLENERMEEIEQLRARKCENISATRYVFMRGKSQ